ALTGLIDENGVRFSSWSYDAQGRATLSVHAGGADNTALVYSGGTATSSTAITDAVNTVRTYGFQTVLSVVRKTSETRPAASGAGTVTSTSAYDANGNVASRTDFNGNTTTYAYDLARNLETSRTEAAGTPQARTISTQWHPVFRL